MAFLSRPFTRKPPPGPIILDPNNALTKGIVMCLPFMDAHGPQIDIVPGPQRTDNGAATWGSGPSGNNAKFWNFSNATTADVAFSTTGVFSVLAFFQCTDASGTSSPVIIGRSLYTSESVNVGWSLQISNSTVYSFNLFNNNAFGSYLLSSVRAPSVGDHMLVGTNNGTNLRSFYVDGRLEGTLTSNPVPLATSAVFSDGLTGATSLYLAVVWNRCISAQEVQSLYRNPWQLFYSNAPADRMTGAAVASLPLPRPFNLQPILAQ